MNEQVTGKVISNPVTVGEICFFLIENSDEKFLVISRGMQSVKDNIFIKEGQLLKSSGMLIDIKNIHGILIPESSVIELKKSN